MFSVPPDAPFSLCKILLTYSLLGMPEVHLKEKLAQVSILVPDQLEDHADLG